jgi:hypothetical protein
MFVPYQVLACLTLDVEAAGRYALPWMVVYAVLTADAFALIARGRTRVETGLTMLTIAALAAWTWPAVSLQRTSVAPPVAALTSVREQIPADVPVFIPHEIGPQADVILPERRTFWGKAEDIDFEDGRAWVVESREVDGARIFSWPRENVIWDILRRRNFEASLIPASSTTWFGEGWQVEKSFGRRLRLWMSSRGVVRLAPRDGDGVVHLHLALQRGALENPPLIEVSVNGVTIDRFRGDRKTIEKTWRVGSRRNEMNEMVITATTQGSRAPDAGLVCELLTWSSPD